MTPNWSIIERIEDIKKVKGAHFDIVIIGGGATGAGIAREVALRGLRFLLIDKEDFASGTSSRSSKLTHGGLRYIKNLQFKVVRESTTERNWLRTHFPNLVRPLAFNVVSYEDYMYSPTVIKAACKLYNIFSDTFSKFKNFHKPVNLTEESFFALEPHARKEKYQYAAYYYDNNVDDSRLTLESIKDALTISNTSQTNTSLQSFALNYVKAIGFVYEGDKIVGIKIRDEISDEGEFEVKSTQVINATGIWADKLLNKSPTTPYIRPTKGVHIVVKNERLGNTQAYGLKSPSDGRFYFILRRGKYSLIGTTDTDYDPIKEDIDNPICLKEDCDYLLEGVNFLFPDAHLTDKDIISAYAGLRPLVVDPKSKNPSDVSRKHVIIDHEQNEGEEKLKGLISLLGGKHTIYRKMAEDLLFYLVKKGVYDKKRFKKGQLKKKYSMQPFNVGLTREKFDSKYLKGKGNEYPEVDDLIQTHLYQQYGKQAFSILQIIKKSPKKGLRFIEENEFIPAEIEWICKNECAPTLLDIVMRRTEISIYVHHSKSQEIAQKVADIMADIYHWDDKIKQNEIKSYVNYVKSWVWL